MTAETIPTDFFNAFADYVHQRKGEIGRPWMRETRESADAPPAINLTAKVLEDRVPAVMDELVEQLHSRFANRAETARHARSRGRPSASVGGSGLGLSLCKEFAELLGGRIEVQSQLGQGTRFEVTLPLNRPAAASRDGAVPAPPADFLQDASQPAFAVL
jgi:hypothetical protein